MCARFSRRVPGLRRSARRSNASNRSGRAAASATERAGRSFSAVFPRPMPCTRRSCGASSATRCLSHRWRALTATQCSPCRRCRNGARPQPPRPRRCRSSRWRPERQVAVKIYAVGGAVRDELLGLPVADRDHVVVGSTPEEMVRLGYKPVGKDFPVFLHPRTHEEHALARTERKVARGYKGFQIHAAPDVTLEQDLGRRDLTINAMARDEAGQLVDPFGGAADLERGLLRHVSPAFVEDPVRILRVARFAARFGFAVAPETMALMRSMVANGEADALVPERVWQEFSKGLMEGEAALMFPVLAEAGLLRKLLPELNLAFEHGRPANDPARVLVRSLECAAAERLGLAPRFALVACGAPTVRATRALSERLRAPGDCRDLALLARQHGQTIKRAPTLGARDLLALLERSDALRRPERFDELLAVLSCVERGERGWTESPYMPRVVLRRAPASARAGGGPANAAPGAETHNTPKPRRAPRGPAHALVLKSSAAAGTMRL